MTRSRTPQTAFSSGEIDPLLHAREDFQRHQTGLAICRGFVPLRQGGITRAPGTIYRGRTRGDAAAVLVPFIFARDDAVMLEFSDGKMRVWRYGAPVLAGADPYEIDTPFTASDLPNLRHTQDADVMYLVDGRNPMQQLSRFALDNWTIGDATLEAGPFRPQNLEEAKTIQCVLEDVGAEVAPFAEEESLTIGDLRKSGVNIYEFRGVGETEGAAVDGTAGWISPSHTAGTEGYTQTDPDDPAVTITVWWKWRYDLDGTGRTVTLNAIGDIFTADHVGALYLLSPEDWNDVPIWVGNAGLEVGSLVRFDGQVYEVRSEDESQSKTNSGVNPPVHISGTVKTDASQKVRYRHVSTETGVVRITAFTDANTVTAEGVTSLPAPLFDDPTYRWSEGAWNDVYGRPAYLTFHEQRLFAAGAESEPRTISASEQGAYRSFLPGSFDTSSFSFDIGGGGSRNAINWLADGRRGIYIGSLGEVRRGHGGQGGDPIGPLTFRPEIVSQDGSAAIDPVLPYGWPIYITRDLGRVLEVRYNFSQDEMSPLELSLPSQHLGDAQFLQIVWQSAPEQMGWFRRGDGTLVCLIYDPEQDVLGWSVVPLAGGFCEYLAVGPSSDSAADVVMAIVRRTIDGEVVRCLEDISSNAAVLRGACDVVDANHAYCAARFDPDPATGTFSVPHLAGETVSAWTDRGGFDGLTVGADGSVALPATVTRATIGLVDATQRARTLPLRAPARDGDSRGRERTIGGATVILHCTAGGRVRVVEKSIGRAERLGHAYPLLDPPAGSERPLAQSGTVPLQDMHSSWSIDVAVQFEPEGLAPLTVLGVVPVVEERGE